MLLNWACRATESSVFRRLRERRWDACDRERPDAAAVRRSGGPAAAAIPDPRCKPLRGAPSDAERDGQRPLRRRPVVVQLYRTRPLRSGRRADRAATNRPAPGRWTLRHLQRRSSAL